MQFISIEEFSSNNLKGSVIKVVNSEPILNKVSKLKVITPTGTMVGNIKAFDEGGKVIDLNPTKGTEVFPKLVFPFQIKPDLKVVDY
jgi:hypothetical protein